MGHSVADTLTPVLTDNWADDRAWTLEAYEARGGYSAWTPPP
jgi:NADH-quinone oxidoreductase subunit F